MAKNIDIGFMAYIFSTLSVIFAFFQPLAGVVLGVIAVRQASGQKSALEKKARKLGIIGIVIGAIIFILSVVMVYTQALNSVGI